MRWKDVSGYASGTRQRCWLLHVICRDAASRNSRSEFLFAVTTHRSWDYEPVDLYCTDGTAACTARSGFSCDAGFGARRVARPHRENRRRGDHCDPDGAEDRAPGRHCVVDMSLAAASQVATGYYGVQYSKGWVARKSG